MHISLHSFLLFQLACCLLSLLSTGGIPSVSIGSFEKHVRHLMLYTSRGGWLSSLLAWSGYTRATCFTMSRLVFYLINYMKSSSVEKRMCFLVELLLGLETCKYRLRFRCADIWLMHFSSFIIFLLRFQETNYITTVPRRWSVTTRSGGYNAQEAFNESSDSVSQQHDYCYQTIYIQLTSRE